MVCCAWANASHIVFSKVYLDYLCLLPDAFKPWPFLPIVVIEIFSAVGIIFDLDLTYLVIIKVSLRHVYILADVS